MSAALVFLKCVAKVQLFFKPAIPEERKLHFCITKLLQKSEMRKEIVIELSYKGFSRASDYS